MKRSKIFLAVTTGLLAVVGVVSAKAHKAFTNIQYFHTNGGGVKGCTIKVTNEPVKRTSGTWAGATQYGVSCLGPVYVGEAQ